MAKVKEQSIPATEPTYYPPGDVVYFGEQFRASLTPATNVKGQPPLWGVTTKTKKGSRAATRTKRKDSLWYDPSFLPAPFLPEDVADVTLKNKFGHQTTRRILFKKAIALWNNLTKESRICWFNKAKDSGAKCSYFDFFMRSQLTAWRLTDKFDLITCNTCLAPNISFTTQQMSFNQTQALSVPDTGLGPYKWSIAQGGGSLSISSGLTTLYTAPSSNPNCSLNPTIRVMNRCKNYAQLKLAVRALSFPWFPPAFVYVIWAEFAAPERPCSSGPWCVAQTRHYTLCSGVIASQIGAQQCSSVCTGPLCVQCQPHCPMSCITSQCCTNPGPCGGNCKPKIIDLRTQEMKNAGCCIAEFL